MSHTLTARSTLLLQSIENAQPLELPLFCESVRAGFPSPAQDYQDGNIDLVGTLVQKPTSTFCVTVIGDSMMDANLHDGDILIVDRDIEARNGDIIIAILDGEFTVKTLHRSGGAVTLMPQNRKFAPIAIHPEQDFMVWGVVTWSLHKTHR